MYIFVFSSIFLHQNVFATEAGFFPPHFCICSVHSIKGFTRHEALSAIQFVSEFPVHVPFLFIYSCINSAHFYGVITQCWLLL